MPFQVFFQVRKTTNYIYFTFFNCLCFFTDYPGYFSKSGKKRKPQTLLCDVSTTITKKPEWIIHRHLWILKSTHVMLKMTQLIFLFAQLNPKIFQQNECIISKAQDNTHSTNRGIALEKICLPQFWTYQQIG